MPCDLGVTNTHQTRKAICKVHFFVIAAQGQTEKGYSMAVA